mgnify:CR=1 FL=1
MSDIEALTRSALAEVESAASLEALHETDFVVEVVTRLNAIFKTKPVAEWEAFLSENNVSCERMRSTRVRTSM